MKKLKLKALELGVRETLSRIQLKNIAGGTGSGGAGMWKCCDYDVLQNPGAKCSNCTTSTCGGSLVLVYCT